MEENILIYNINIYVFIPMQLEIQFLIFFNGGGGHESHSAAPDVLMKLNSPRKHSSCAVRRRSGHANFTLSGGASGRRLLVWSQTHPTVWCLCFSPGSRRRQEISLTWQQNNKNVFTTRLVVRLELWEQRLPSYHRLI